MGYLVVSCARISASLVLCLTPFLVDDVLGRVRCFDNDNTRGEEDCLDLATDLTVSGPFSRFFILWMNLSSLSGTSGVVSWGEAATTRLERFP